MLAERFYAARYWALAICLLILVYCNLYLWLFIPYAAYDFNWRPDHYMQIVAFEEDSVVAPYLMEGDHILAVDGRPVQRSSTFFPPTVRQTTYLLTLYRNGETFEESVPYIETPDTNAIALRAVSGVLSLSFWVVGALVLHYSWRKNRQAVWLGYVFLLTAVTVISWNATLMGVPFTWITSQPLLFVVAVAWMYLGLLPTYEPFGQKTRMLFHALFCLAAGLGLLAFVEGLILFPHNTSVQAITGVSMYKVCAATLALSGLIMFGLLVSRRLKAQAVYLRQQLNILLVFVTIGVGPAVFLTFIPLAAWDAPILSMPLAMMGLIAVPIGYFYTIFRHAYLDLDGKFGRTVPYVLLILLFTIVYSLSLRTLDEQYGDGLNLVLPAVLLFVVMAALMPSVSAWFEVRLRDLFYGRVLATPAQINTFAHSLAYHPDLDNLKHIVNEICVILQVSTATLSFKSDTQLLKPSVQIGRLTWSKRATDAWLLEQTIVRTVQQREERLHPLFAELPWAEVALPLRVRQQTIGLWVLARPHDRYYDQETIAFLEHAASALAMGNEIIVLLDSAESLSREIMDVQEEERRAFASQLHDQPLQRLTAARMRLNHIVEEIDVANEEILGKLSRLAADLSALNTELRNIYDAVFPKIIEYGLDLSLQALADHFRFEHDLAITLDVEDLTVAEERTDTRLGRVTYRIVFEALNNVVKHSGASAVKIGAHCHDGTFAVTVADNGRNQPLSTLSTTQLLRGRHFGIAGMHAWAKSIGGHLVVSSNTAGTQVAFKVPLHY